MGLTDIYDDPWYGDDVYGEEYFPAAEIAPAALSPLAQPIYSTQAGPVTLTIVCRRFARVTS